MSGKDNTSMRQPENLALALERSEERFRNIIHRSADGIVIVDINGTICFINPAAEKIFCQEAGELIGASFGFPVVAGETTELDILCNGDKTSIVEMRVTETEWEGNDAFLATLRDVTDRKRAKEEIEKLNLSLASRAAELETVNRELEAFSYSVSHDLRNPLNVISLCCQTIREIYRDRVDEECCALVQTIFDTTMRMDQMIESLLSCSRLAHAEPHFETVCLSFLAQAVAVELRLSEPERRAAFVIEEEIKARGDAKLLRVVLNNLLGNAWKYTSSKEDGLIEFGSAAIDGMETYYVRDNGAGFDMADAQKLFIPFQRLPGAAEYKGFGIGLATVERIIHRHGGRIWAEGEPDKGATFYFTLNCHDSLSQRA
jgi:signal transduction histidine kinase